MNIVKLNWFNCTFAEDQPEYLPLPAHKSKDGIVTSCWGLNLFERFKVLFLGHIFLQVMTFNKSLQPVKLCVDKPDLEG